jgi:hypothetical protein
MEGVRRVKSTGLTVGVGGFEIKTIVEKGIC